MSRIKNAELDDKALDVAETILDIIQMELDKPKLNEKKIVKLAKVYQIIKPFI